MILFRSGSAEELAANAGDFVLLPEDEYLAEVTAMTLWPASEQSPSQYTPVPVDQYKATLKFISFADGSPLEDTDGNAVDEFTLTAIINHNKMGMVPQPSRARKFFAALLKQPVGQAIEIANFPDDLIGKQLYVATINKKDAKGGEWTRAQDYRPTKIERTRRSKADAATSEAKSEEVGADEIADDEIKF